MQYVLCFINGHRSKPKREREREKKSICQIYTPWYLHFLERYQYCCRRLDWQQYMSRLKHQCNVKIFSILINLSFYSSTLYDSFIRIQTKRTYRRVNYSLLYTHIYIYILKRTKKEDSYYTSASFFLLLSLSLLSLLLLRLLCVRKKSTTVTISWQVLHTIQSFILSVFFHSLS